MIATPAGTAELHGTFGEFSLAGGLLVLVFVLVLALMREINERQ